MELEVEKGPQDKAKEAPKPAAPAASKLYKPEVALAFFKSTGQVEKLAAGKPVFVENDVKGGAFAEGSRMYFLASGQVELSANKKVIGSVARGEIFGEMAPLAKIPRTATAVARTACTVISLNEKQFQTAIGKFPEFALMLMAIVIGRLRETIHKVSDRLGEGENWNQAAVFERKLLVELEREFQEKPPTLHHLNKVIMKEGDRGIFMYVVHSGVVSVSIGEKVIEKVGPGGVFGEIALVDQSVRAATATAEADCMLLTINRNDFMQLVKNKPAFALSLLKALSERLRFMTAKLK
jgi:CRP/FNR family transcriptional regulator, cyclic AMP receptor protein